MKGRVATFPKKKNLRGHYEATIGGKKHNLGRDKETAQTTFAFLMRQAGKGEEPDGSLTFREVANRRLAFVEATMTAKRFRAVASRLREFNLFIGLECKVKDITALMVENWLAERKGANLVAGSETQYKAMILGCLNWAAKPVSRRGPELIPVNPLRGQLDLPAGGSRGAESVWSPETFDLVVRNSHPAFADVVRILAWTGCRPGLVCKVSARNYNAALRRWDVAEFSCGNKRAEHIHLTDEAVVLVERLNKLYPDGPIFRNCRGAAWTSDNLRQYLNDLKGEGSTAGLAWPPCLILYGLRHTFCTNYLRQHPDEIEWLAQFMGHSTTKMIRKHYSHLLTSKALSDRMAKFNPFA